MFRRLCFRWRNGPTTAGNRERSNRFAARRVIEIRLTGAESHLPNIHWAVGQRRYVHGFVGDVRDLVTLWSLSTDGSVRVGTIPRAVFGNKEEDRAGVLSVRVINCIVQLVSGQ